MSVKVDLSKEEDINIYVNTSIYNDTNNAIPARIQNQRTQAFLDKAEDYVMTIARFDIGSENIPIFFFKDNNYSVTLRHPNTSTESPQEFVVYIPYGTIEANDPNQPVFHYNHMLQLINTALANAFTNLGALPAGSPTAPPQMIYEESSGLFSLWLPLEYDDSNLNTVEIYFNEPLYSFFDTFNDEFNGYGQPNGKDVRIRVNSTPNNLLPLLSPTPTIIKVSQEYSALGLWYDIVSMVILTNTLPTNGESIIINNTSTNVSLPILTDYIVYVQNPIDALDRWIYNADNYRWIDVNYKGSLSKIDFQIYWVSKDQTLHQLYIEPNRHISIKVLFRKKQFIT